MCERASVYRMSSDPWCGEGETAMQYTYPWWADESMLVAGILRTIHSVCEEVAPEDFVGVPSLVDSAVTVC